MISYEWNQNVFWGHWSPHLGYILLVLFLMIIEEDYFLYREINLGKSLISTILAIRRFFIDDNSLISSDIGNMFL